MLGHALLAVAVLWTATQQPPRDPVPSSTASRTAVIHGRVIDDAGRPVGGALVSVVGVSPGGARTAVTGDDGRFVVEELPSGRVVVTAGRAGYARGEYGRRSPHAPGTAIALQPGERFQADIVVPRGAVLAGVVTYENGEPVPDVGVAAHVVRPGGERHTWQVAGTSTDRNGAFRLWGLPAGEYSIRSFSRFDDLSAFREGSRTVAVGPGEERTVHLELERGGAAAAAVEGTALGPDGQPFDRLDVQLVAAATRDVLRSPVVKDDGTFRFRAVPAGRYRLVARGTVYGAPAAGSRVRTSTQYVGLADVYVDGGEAVTVPVTLGPGVSLAGRIVASPSTTAQLDSKMVYVGVSTPDLPDGVLGHHLAVRREPDGRFEVQGIPPGRYTMRVSMAPALAGWTPVSAMARRVDMLDFPIQVDEDIRGVVLTLTDRQTSLAATVRDAAGAAVHEVSVVIYSPDPRYGFPGSRRLALVRPDTHGELRIENLPAGDYRIAVVRDVPASWEDAAFLEALRPAARVALREGERVTREILAGR